jgi:hypothetical protein
MLKTSIERSNAKKKREIKHLSLVCANARALVAQKAFSFAAASVGCA